MKLNPLKMISPATQKLLLGGLVGSLSYWADMAIADTQPAYPAQLKQKLAPQLPRNDELLTSIAPPAIMWVVGKKSPKIKEMAKGTVLYSLPHLMQRIVVNAVTPVATAGLAMRFASPPAGNRQPIPVQRQTPTVAQSVGKYR
jgi:hypothetical protein